MLFLPVIQADQIVAELDEQWRVLTEDLRGDLYCLDAEVCVFAPVL